MVSVVAEFVLNVQEHQNTTGQPDSETDYVDRGIPFVLQEVSYRCRNVVAYHGTLPPKLIRAFGFLTGNIYSSILKGVSSCSRIAHRYRALSPEYFDPGSSLPLSRSGIPR